MGSPFNKLNAIRAEELSSFSEENEARLRPYSTKAWQENRAARLGENPECEWCGDTDGPFQIHHLESIQWTRVWTNATDDAFTTADAFDPSLGEGREECPSCGLRDYYARKTKDPTYRCNNCGEEFADPQFVPPGEVIRNDRYDTKPYTSYAYYEAKAAWVDENRDAVHDAFDERVDKAMNEYVELNEDNTVVICQSCHFQEEQTSNTRCSNCGEWHGGNRSLCWECFAEEKGIEQCPDCGDGWYQPDSYDACSDCRED